MKHRTHRSIATPSLQNGVRSTSQHPQRHEAHKPVLHSYAQTAPPPLTTGEHPLLSCISCGAQPRKKSLSALLHLQPIMLRTRWRCGVIGRWLGGRLWSSSWCTWEEGDEAREPRGDQGGGGEGGTTANTELGMRFAASKSIEMNNFAKQRSHT